MSVKRMNCITVNTDASFKKGVAAYAFYIVCDMFKIQKGGYFKNRVKDPHDAECMCIGNALHTLLMQKQEFECLYLVVNTDSQISINRIENGYSYYGKRVSKILKKLCKKLKCKSVHFKHVKAHSGKNDSRSWVNEWCDREAKKYRLIREKQLRNENQRV